VSFGARCDAVSGSGSSGGAARSRVDTTPVSFGVPKRYVSLRSGSSERGHRSEVVARFHGGLQRAGGGPQRLFGAGGAAEGRQAASTRASRRNGDPGAALRGVAEVNDALKSSWLLIRTEGAG
jgi:hypothetical protein